MSDPRVANCARPAFFRPFGNAPELVTDLQWRTKPGDRRLGAALVGPVGHALKRATNKGHVRAESRLVVMSKI